MRRFKDTSELEPLKDILGQDRAISAMELGLKIDNPAYNIYVAGESGTGRSTYTLKAVNKYAKTKNNHKDWCYVYNFDNPRQPVVISLERGMGKDFKEDIEEMIDTLFEEIKDAFDSEDYEINKNALLEGYEMEKEALIKKIKDYGEEKGFKLKSSKLGMVFVPLDENFEDEVSSEEFFKIKKELENMAIKVVYQIREIEDNIKKIMTEIEEEVGKVVIDPHINRLRDKYKENEKVNNYLDQVRDDILKNLELFYLDDDEIREIYSKDCFLKYSVNLFVDNQDNENVPVIIETNPSPAQLFGKVEYDYNNGNRKLVEEIKAYIDENGNFNCNIANCDYAKNHMYSLKNEFFKILVEANVSVKEIS